MWDLVEKKVGTGSSGTITFSSLDGDADKLYRIIGTGNASSAALAQLYWNGAATNVTTNNWYDNAGTWTRDTGGTRLFVPTNTDVVQMEILIYADKTVASVRLAMSEVTLGGTTNVVHRGAHRYNDTTTNITSLALVLSTGNWTTKSEFWLYKLSDPTG